MLIASSEQVCVPAITCALPELALLSCPPNATFIDIDTPGATVCKFCVAVI